MNRSDLLDIMFSARELRNDPPVPSTGHKSYMTSQAQKDAPTADLGTGEVGSLRYFVVKVERGRWTIYDRIQAEHTWAASKAAFEGNPGARSVQVLREIDKAEFDRFQRRG